MSPGDLVGLFASPAVLPAAVLGAAALAAAWAAFRRKAGRRREALVPPALAGRTGLVPPAPGWAVPLSLALLALLGIGAALARPRWGETAEKAERRGADVVLLIDTSASMRAADVSPSRFILARQAAASLLERLAGDRVALVACEGEAQTLVPLTLDTAAAGLFLDALEPGIGARPGTSLAAGLKAATELFPAGAVGGKHCVVLSDGEDLEGGVDEAIEKAKGEGIAVHAVFVGAPNGRGAPVPDVDVAGRTTGYKSDESGAPVLSRPDPELLRRLAARTGGTYSVVSPGRTDLDGVAGAIDRAARRPLAGVLLTSREERFQIPLAAAVAASGLLLLGAGSLRLPRRHGAAAGLALAAVLSGHARAQTGAGTPAQAPVPQPSPAPTPAPGAARLSRVAGGPPFTTARGEAKAGKKALEAKQGDEAIRRFARQVELDPKDPTGAYNLGTALSLSRRSPEALVSLERARKAGTRDLASDAAYNAGETLFREGRYEAAAGAFREALRLRPGDADASWNWELCARRAEEEKKAQQKKQGTPTPTPSAGRGKDEEKKKREQKEKEDREFESKAKMSRDKADQILAAIQQADLEEQKKKIAEQKKRRRVARDW